MLASTQGAIMSIMFVIGSLLLIFHEEIFGKNEERNKDN